MNIYQLYSPTSGLFFNVTIMCKDEDVILNTQGDQSCLVGEYDHLSQKVDLQTGMVVDYIPPQPSINHAYDEATKRWVYVPTDEDIARQVRSKRDQLFAASDWVTLRAFRTNTPIPQPWLAYQTALEDLPTQPGFPREIIWPTIPTEE